jgi:hypothetical protein
MIPNHPMTFTLGWVTASVTCELTVVGNESIIKTGCSRLDGRSLDEDVLLRKVKL